MTVQSYETHWVRYSKVGSCIVDRSSKNMEIRSMHIKSHAVQDWITIRLRKTGQSTVGESKFTTKVHFGVHGFSNRLSDIRTLIFVRRWRGLAKVSAEWTAVHEQYGKWLSREKRAVYVVAMVWPETRSVEGIRIVIMSFIAEKLVYHPQALHWCSLIVLCTAWTDVVIYDNAFSVIHACCYDRSPAVSIDKTEMRHCGVLYRATLHLYILNRASPLMTLIKFAWNSSLIVSNVETEVWYRTFKFIKLAVEFSHVVWWRQYRRAH